VTGLVFTALLAVQDWKAKSFEEDGIRISVPGDWTVGGASREPRLLVAAGIRDETLKPAPLLLVFHDRVGRPGTLTTFRKEVREAVEKDAIEFKLVEERDLKVKAWTGFVMVFTAKTDKTPEKAVELEGVRVGLLLAPRRYLLVDVTYPKTASDKLRPIAEKVAQTVDLFDPKEPAAAKKGVEAFKPILEKWSSFPSAFSTEQKLDYDIGKKTVGTYTLSVKDESVEGKPGYRLDQKLAIDLEKEGKTESKAAGFVACDLSLQILEVSDTRVSATGERFEYSATATIRDGKAQVKRKIQGEESAASFEVPKGTILYDFLDVILLRIIEYGRSDFHIRTLSVFDPDTRFLRIECSELQKIRIDGEKFDAHVIFVSKGDAPHVTYYIEGGRAILHMKNAPFYMKRAK